LGSLAFAAVRPHYGGTLRIAIKDGPQNLDPATLAEGNSGNIARLIFETLVQLDERGHPQPSLATSWQSEAGGQRWRFTLRPGVIFSDGTALDATAVVASLRSANPGWKVVRNGDAVVIETDSPHPDLPAELALLHNSIVRRGGQLSGTGPFTITQWLSGKHATLAANDHYWAGRPYLDSVEIDFGKSDRDQAMLLDLGKTDAAEIAPENIHRARTEGRNVVSSEAHELIALVFDRDPQSEDELHARNALAFSIDAAALNNVVLQGGGEPAGALLPDWISGYGFAFTPDAKPEHVREERSQIKRSPSWTLGYDATDPIARVIAERILLNARDAGVTLQLTSAASDLRLVRLNLAGSDAHVALNELAQSLRLPAPKFAEGSVTELYAAEKSLLQTHRVVPLMHVRSAIALRPTIREWRTLPDGGWQLNNIWLGAEKP
jgi:MarR-like DNA-binding transcriptional regulator SgrR of sgrS sRNA